MLRFAFRTYGLPFRTTVNTAHGPWRERKGLIVRLEDEAGRCGWGEAAPIPWFGTESADDAAAVCAGLGARVDVSLLAAVPEKFGCLRHALANAQAELAAKSAAVASQSSEAPAAEVEGNGSAKSETANYLAVAALLPAGKAVLGALRPKAEAGFRVFKWKVGVGDLADELALLDDVCAALPEGSRLRLDANGAWDRRQAERWLERCAERPVEFVEQPCFAAACAGATAARKAEDVLLGLAADYPTPLALDESIVNDGDVRHWLAAGWRGVFVVKPSLFADAPGAIGQLAKAKASVVFSSALETAVGARSALRLAFAWRGERRAIGFGVWPLFADRRCDGPAATPFLRATDVEHIDAEAVWNALS